MLDFYDLRSEVKASLLRRWQQLEIATDPLIWAWIVYTFYLEGTTNNPLLEQALKQSKLWLASDEAWNSDGYLGSIGLLCYLLHDRQDSDLAQMTPRINQRIQDLQKKEVGKFSRLNDPDFVFGLALGVGRYLPDDLREWLMHHCERSAQPGNWRRGLLFAAAASELNGTVSPFAINGSQLQVHEVLPAVWFVERYPLLIDGPDRVRGVWEAFERVREGVSLEMTPSDTGPMYQASPIDIAMLYESLLQRTRNIDPVTLFNNIPWHPQVRQASEGLFTKGEYVMAVFQAGVSFVDAVKNKAGHPAGKNGVPLDGGPLMSHVFGSKHPRLKFTNMGTITEQNEHRGLALIAEGIVSAFRNPKGHAPQTTIPLGPYEALEQLSTISYLMRRLDLAHIGVSEPRRGSI